jgi:hypothetical protein
MNIFEKASREKLRFQTTKGFVTTEDLWDLSLDSLDNIAIATREKLEKASTKSFVAKKTTGNKKLELELEVLKHVITDKVEKIEAAKFRSKNQAELATLEALAAEKQMENLKSLSIEDLQKRIEELKSNL